MKTMADLVSDIMSLNGDDLEDLAKALVLFNDGKSINRAEVLQYFLSVFIEDEQRRSEEKEEFTQ